MNKNMLLLMGIVIIVNCACRINDSAVPEQFNDRNRINSIHYVFIETAKDTFFYTLIDSLKNCVPITQERKFICPKLEIGNVNYPVIEKQSSKRTLSGTTSYLSNKSGFKISYRHTGVSDRRYIIVKEFDGYFEAEQFRELLELSNFYNRRNNKCFSISEKDASLLYAKEYLIDRSKNK